MKCFSLSRFNLKIIVYCFIFNGRHQACDHVTASFRTTRFPPAPERSTSPALLEQDKQQLGPHQRDRVSDGGRAVRVHLEPGENRVMWILRHGRSAVTFPTKTEN